MERAYTLLGTIHLSTSTTLPIAPRDVLESSPPIPALAAVQMTSSYLTSHHHQQHQISCGLLLTVATTRTGSPITTVQSYRSEERRVGKEVMLLWCHGH